MDSKWTAFKQYCIDLLKNRSIYMALFVIVGMFLLVAKLYDIQIVNGDEYKKQASSSVDRTVKLAIDSPRGNIYDRNGVLLATTTTAYQVQMTNVDKEQSYRDEMYLRLINLFEENGDEYENFLKKYLASPTQWGSALEGEENTEKRLDWINSIAKKKSDRELIVTAEDAFNYLRNVRFGLNEDYSDEDAYKIMIIRYGTFSQGLSYTTPMVLVKRGSFETMETLVSQYIDYPGVNTEEVYYREYVNAEAASHILGYVRAISNEEYQELKDKGYSSDDIIGKTGIEKAAESYLRGESGYREVYFEDGVLKEKSFVEPIPGNDIYLTIDYNLQQACVETLEEQIAYIASQTYVDGNMGDANAGSIVVMNAKTGEVLAMANYPTYDNSIFLEPSSNQEAQQAIIDLFKDPDSASLNRATQGLYPIGSTVKPVVAIAALENGLTDNNREIYCAGHLEINNHIHKCLAKHGNLALKMALVESCNVYFQTIGVEAGIDEVDKWIEAFGLGNKTGIEVAEYAGYRSNPDTMAIKESDIYHKWSDSDTAQSSIGQLYTLFTPMQLCVYSAALGNGGYLKTPYLIKNVVAKDGTVVEDDSEKSVKSSKVDVSEESLYLVKDAMKHLGSDGYYAQIYFKGFPKGFVAAKTGTPETGLEAFGQSSHAVLICYAPADDPEIAISIVVEHGAWGSNNMPIAAKIMQEYFGELNNVNHDTISRAEGAYWQTLL